MNHLKKNFFFHKKVLTKKKSLFCEKFEHIFVYNFSETKYQLFIKHSTIGELKKLQFKKKKLRSVKNWLSYLAHRFEKHGFEKNAF